MTQLFEYLEQLKLNNNREWFNAHKDTYTALRELWLADLQRTISALSQHDPTLKGVQAKDCAYRIYRDIRFKADKTPYKNYFSACIGINGRKTMQSCYYLHFEPGNAGIYFGIWCPEPEHLRSLRSLINAYGDELQSLTTNPDFAGRFEFMPMSSLKKAPVGFPADHPQIEFLKAKDLTFGHNVADDYFTNPDWPERVANDLMHAIPVCNFLNYVFE